MEKKVICDKLSVDCANNDPVDIRCGGPEILGFDFYVLQEETETMKSFIIDELQKLKVPIMNIYVSDVEEKKESEVWNKERILTSLINEAEDIKHEASRNYPPYHSRTK